MNNSKGVTLVELLAVLVILGIIALIAVPAIARVIDDSKVNSLKSTAINSINAAELYMTTNGTEVVNHSDIEGEYIKERTGLEWTSGPNYELDETGEIRITGTASIDENLRVRFGGASVDDINNDNNLNVYKD